MESSIGISYSLGEFNFFVEDGIEMMAPFSTLAQSPSDDDVEFQPLAEFSVIEDEGTDTNSTRKFAMIRRVIIE